MLTVEQFDEFFQELHRYRPFQWQRLLARRVAAEGWPEGIDLPTASGKTACLDIALFTLALSVQREEGLLLPRRIFFVVDRRIVVDEAADRAARIADRLRNANSGLLKVVADTLRQLGCSEEPLVVAKMRGGTIRDDRWVDNPAQPAIITSTVDQVGSRLLFRGYGPGKFSQSIHAGLIAYDSLILLDEAHCAVPFMQTVRAIQRYAGPEWMEASIANQAALRPMQLVVLSATLPPEIPLNKRFPKQQEHKEILADECLKPRVHVEKRAELAVASTPPKRHWTLGDRVVDDPLVLDLAHRAARLAQQGHKRIAVMVNRVATAWYIWQQLHQAASSQTVLTPESANHSQPGPLFDVVLMTGRMRPIDRDQLIHRWSPVLKANPEQEPERPIILVTTQCLEVGADFSFDALLTECASLDALRQRFGRLNRLGTSPISPSSAILISEKPKVTSLSPQNLEKLRDDAIYGKAVEATWLWLLEHASDGQIDMSTGNLDRIIQNLSEEQRRFLLEQEKVLLAPAKDAPILLPMHLDFLCQTSPHPAPDPDVALFLHGPDWGMPEARLVFRGDLRPAANEAAWLDAIALVPPIAAEALSIPLPYLRRWLAGEDLRPMAPDKDLTGDLEGRTSPEHADQKDSKTSLKSVRFLLWRGRRHSKVTTDPEEVAPEDVVVVPADQQRAEQLAHYFTRPPGVPLDVAEQARWQTRQQAILRIHPRVLDSWKSFPPIAQLLDWADKEDRDESALPDLLRAIVSSQPAEAESILPDWFRSIIEQLIRGKLRIESHPQAGLVLFADHRTFADVQRDEFADEDESTSTAPAAILLDRHLQQVEQKARQFASACGLGNPLVEDIALAARLHDLGKADARFQAFLRGSWPMALPPADLLAKSATMPSSVHARHQRRRRAELPPGFRHEMLSVQLAERANLLPHDQDRRNLILHLIAAHHGHARPFAPVCQDSDLPDVTVELNAQQITLPHQDRKQLVPPHRLDSGIPERFWRLTHRYGWWGLAYLEAILRLADWYASTHPVEGSDSSSSLQGVPSHA